MVSRPYVESATSRRVRPVAAWLVAAMVAGCAASEPPSEQVLVTVRAEPNVTAQLVRLEALVYAADARIEHQPLAAASSTSPWIATRPSKK